MIAAKLKEVYFLGIGGIGMSAIARYFHAQGIRVSGYDKTPSPLTDALIASGMKVSFDESVEALPESVKQASDEVLLVYTPAIPAQHAQKKYFEAQGRRLYKRSEVLGLITQSNPTLAVAGTHGKTTTSTLLTHLMVKAGVDSTAFLGGIAVNYGSNYIQANNPATAPVIVEADEYDRSFLTLHPHMALISSMDADHLDIYGESSAFEEGFRQFASQVKGKLFVREGLNPGRTDFYTYGISETADYCALNVRIENGAYVFDLKTPVQLIENLSCGLPGRHNVENAVGASAIALEYGITPEQLREALASYRGVKRRFEYIVKETGKVYIDDYAHHPTELSAFIQSAKELFPNKPLLGVFQPHLFTRTRDFMEGFAESLSMLDTLVLMDIYPAREEPIEGINSSALLAQVSIADKHLLPKEAIVDFVKERNPEILLTMGAGDIDRLVPQLKEVMQ
ncbi:MAG: UDP-N-acetylmuramate--L-alanine ligase [Bacteroidetes bacterium]|nr:MAG: UDP-N-acetylmuramate--L-alanine ligase [Bacteroidota bacterium]